VAAISENVSLSPHYYRDNFLRLCDTVESQYADLLDASETAFLGAYRALSFDAQCLYVRLVSRVGPWFRASRLDYPELGDSGPILGELDHSGLLQVASTLCPDELGVLYTRDELLVALGDHLDTAGVRDKPSLLAAIAGSALDGRAAIELLTQLDGDRIVAPLGCEAVEILQLLFFGNRRQRLTEFVLSDLGVTRYFPYSLDRGHRQFENREALQEYLDCAALRDRWYELRENPDPAALGILAAELLSMEISYDSSRDRWDRLRNGVARDLERAGDFDNALALYTVSNRHPARERRARILEGRGELQAARHLCDAIVAQPWCEDERDAALRILPRLRRALENRPQPRTWDNFDELRLELPRGDQGVELSVAAALAPDWASVDYVENRLMNTLFGLAFWEQIFAPLPGAFSNPFQSVPGDMYEPGFRRRRQVLLVARIKELAGKDLQREVSSAYRRYQGYQCRWVDWRYLDVDLLDRALGILPPAHLLAIWERMLFDPGENRRGFPDLIALGSNPGDYRLIEVKGPGDTLQHGQRRWLRFFREQSIPACVARVEWLCD
jgi:hypothetical protein